MLPISLEQYQALSASPADFHQLLQEQFKAHPELFPVEFEDGYQLKDIIHSTKMGIRVRRITVSFGERAHNFRVLPSDVLPHMCGKTEEVAHPLFLRKFCVPYWALARVFGRDPNFYYRVECRMAKTSIVGALHGPHGDLPEDVCCDEKHTKHLGEKEYVAMTVGGGCVIGAELCEAADAESLAEGYQVVRDEISRCKPDHRICSINVDGFAATSAALQRVYGSGVVLITCILHLYIAIRDGAKKKHAEVFREIADKLWDACSAPIQEVFTQRWNDLLKWCEDNRARIPERVTSKLSSANKNKLRGYQAAYEREQGHRFSVALDREMGALDRRLFAMRYLHGHCESSNLMIRAWAQLQNFAPWNPRAAKLHDAKCPAERLTKNRYREDWLENFRVASSLQGYRYP